MQDLNKYVAISEEFANKATGRVKSGGLLFDRRVARIVTPGTLIDEKFMNPAENNFLLSIHVDPSSLKSHTLVAGEDSLRQRPILDVDQAAGLAWLDLSTGDFFTQRTTVSQLPSAIARIGAREIVLNQTLQDSLGHEVQTLVGDDHHLVTYQPAPEKVGPMSDWNVMLESPVSASAEMKFTLEEKSAGTSLLEHVKSQLLGLKMKLQPPIRRQLQEVMGIDRNSLRGLEILGTSRDGFGKGSLLHAVRRTLTKSGARLLRDRLTSPSAYLLEIDKRLDLVQEFVHEGHLREDIVSLLKRSYDVQRLVQKFSLGRGDADDLICLARAIEATKGVREVLVQRDARILGMTGAQSSKKGSSDGLVAMLGRLNLEGPAALAARIFSAIDEDGLMKKQRVEESKAADAAALAQEVVMTQGQSEDIEALPKKARVSRNLPKPQHPDNEQEFEDTWIMRQEASETLGRLHGNLRVLRQEKAELTNQLREQIGAPGLTLKLTPGLGHICHLKGSAKKSIETLQAARVVSSTKSTRSFYLPEWSRLGGRIDQAKVHVRTEEQRIFEDIRQDVISNLVKLRRNAAILDELDVACSFAILAEEQSLVRPILNESRNHKIVGGRHPTVKLGLEEQGRPFVSNDCFLGDPERIWLVTGPNMAGKSTFLRQNALITILAQVGSFVPAEHAEIGIVDQIFSRVGAADDLFRDQSTFMVEMLETAAILKHATPRSFVIMDEVGRGTTPEDGTAVGFACLHHLYYTNKCRTLFATHFHQLAEMTVAFEHLGRYCTDVIEDESGSFSFVHSLRKGVNRQSHALKVARLAGLPDSAINVAKDVLQRMGVEKTQQMLPEQSTAPQAALASG